MTLKEMLNQILSEAGFDELNEFFGSTRSEAKQLIALSNRELAKLERDDWQVLKKTHTVTMTTATTYTFPSDYERFVYDTAWGNNQPVDFPVDDAVWTHLTGRGITAGVQHRMRIDGNRLEILDPVDGDTITIEYISNAPIVSASFTSRERFEADNDILLLDDDLFMLGVKWRFLKSRGLEWQADYQEYRELYKSLRAADQSAKTIRTGVDHGEWYPEPQANYWVG